MISQLSLIVNTDSESRALKRRLTLSFVVNKLLNLHEPMIKGVSHAILTAYPPLATNHHGVQFVEFVLSSNRVLQRSNIAKYIDGLCSQKEGWVLSDRPR